MNKRFLALLLTGGILLSGCDLELSQEAKLKAEEVTQVAHELKQNVNASADELSNTFNRELKKTKDNALTKTQNTITKGLSEGTNKQIDSVKEKTEDIDNIKISELLNFGRDDKEEKEVEDKQLP